MLRLWEKELLTHSKWIKTELFRLPDLIFTWFEHHYILAICIVLYRVKSQNPIHLRLFGFLQAAEHPLLHWLMSLRGISSTTIVIYRGFHGFLRLELRLLLSVRRAVVMGVDLRHRTPEVLHHIRTKQVGKTLVWGDTCHHLGEGSSATCLMGLCRETLWLLTSFYWELLLYCSIRKWFYWLIMEWSNGCTDRALSNV